MKRREHAPLHARLEKCPTGIEGLDEVLEGGLPKGRPTLVFGGAGCGKTVLGIEFLVRGAARGEPGALMTFEESADELRANVASLGFDLERMEKDKLLLIDTVDVNRTEIEETGEYDLEGLFVRLGSAIDEIHANRVVIDGIENLFAGLKDTGTLRGELRRLFRWLKDRHVTALITAEKGLALGATRHGIEEYVSDCVIYLDHRIVDQVSTRRLRILKYRGSLHGTNEYPYLIGATGIQVLPVTSVGLTHKAPDERVSSGIASLDALLQGGGFHRGSVILISGTAGTGKSSMAVQFAIAACKRGERVLYMSFEESPDQLVRNMRSIGIDIQSWLDDGSIDIVSTRPSYHGLEKHLAEVHTAVARQRPDLVVLDPITSLVGAGALLDVKSVIMRMLDYLKMSGITTIATCLREELPAEPGSAFGISSLADAWITIEGRAQDGHRDRIVSIRKARGIGHSDDDHRLVFGPNGIELEPLRPEAREPPKLGARA